MTKRIVQSDIDLAQRLIEARLRDAEIVARLQRRGVGQAEAEALVNALQDGRLFTPAPLVVQPISQEERARFAPDPLEPEEPEPRIEQTHGSGSGRAARVLFLVAVILAAASGGFYYWYHLQTTSLLVRLQDLEQALATSAATDVPPLVQESKTVVTSIRSRSLHANERAMLEAVSLRINALAGTGNPSASK